MSPLQQLELAFKQRFPRVSGDEPPRLGDAEKK